MENVKIKNAHKCEYNGIKFQSTLEMETYKVLMSNGFNPKYEPQTFHLWEGKKLSVPCYDYHRDRKLRKDVWGLNVYKPISIKYTPDFILHITTSSKADRMVVLECKGFPNDRYVYVKKLFRSYLEEHHPNSVFLEIHNQKQLKTAVNIIKELQQ